jgi:hypothetical protein
MATMTYSDQLETYNERERRRRHVARPPGEPRAASHRCHPAAPCARPGQPLQMTGKERKKRWTGNGGVHALGNHIGHIADDHET